MSAEIALQKAVAARLVGWSALTALVPADSILDRNERPAPDPSIIIGEGQVRDDGDTIARNRLTIYLDLHVWKRELSLAGVRGIAGQVRKAIGSARLALETGYHCADCHVSDTRYLRDPDGQTSHAVVTVQAIVEDMT